MVMINRRSFVIGAAGTVGSVAAGLAGVAGGSRRGSAPPPTSAHHVFEVDDYGAAPTGTGDSGPAIRDAIAAAAAWSGSAPARSSSVIFSPGTYRVDRASSAAWYALELDGVARLGLYGSDTTLLVATPYAGAISVSRSATIRVDGFTIDYETVPFTQGTITAIDAGAGTFDLALQGGYPSLADTALFSGSGYGTVRVASTGLMKRGGQVTFLFSHGASALPSGSWRLTLTPEHVGRIGDLSVGDGFVTGFRGNWHGIAVYRCSDVTIASITMYASPGAAFIPSDSDGTVIRDCLVTRKPGSSRWISANADGVHNHGGRVGPRIFGNTFEFLHDDGINVYSTSRVVTSTGSGSVTLAGGAIQLAAGDTVQLVDVSTGTVRGETTVVTITGDSLSGGSIGATLAALPAGTVPGDQVFNRSFSAPGADIQYNVFRELRGLGVRLRTDDAYVHANEMFDLANWGIWVGNDPGYHEGPAGSANATIERNSVVRPCLDQTLRGWPSSAAGIMVEHLRDDYDGGASRSHTGHVIRDNYIEDPPRFAIFVGGADEVTVNGNVVASTAGNPRTADPTAIFGTRNSNGVTLSHLTVHEYASTPRDVVWVGPSVTGFVQL